MMRWTRWGRLRSLSCALAVLVAATPALPCALMCAEHMHMSGAPMSAPASLPCSGHPSPTPLTSVAQALATMVMLPAPALAELANGAIQPAPRAPRPVIPAVPPALPQTPPPRTA